MTTDESIPPALPPMGLDAELEAILAQTRAHAAALPPLACAACGRELPRDDAAPDGGTAKCQPCADKALESSQRHRAATWAKLVPDLHREAALDAPWLRTLVGAVALEHAAREPVPVRLLLVGEAGAGKTSLASALLRREILAGRAGAEAIFVKAAQLARVPQAARLGDGNPLAEYMRTPLLILDELGGEAPSLVHVVREVLDERHAHNRRTWVTTGMRRSDLEARYDGGMYRRLTEAARVIQLPGRAVARAPGAA